MLIKSTFTNKLYDNAVDALFDFCEEQSNKSDGCSHCPLKNFNYKDDCVETLVTNFDEAMQAMDCVIVRDKPPVCDLLGVDIDQPFKRKGYDAIYTITKSGMIKDFHLPDDELSSAEIFDILNSADEIIKCDMTTETQNVEDIKNVKALRKLTPIVRKFLRTPWEVYSIQDRERGIHLLMEEIANMLLEEGFISLSEIYSNDEWTT